MTNMQLGFELKWCGFSIWGCNHFLVQFQRYILKVMNNFLSFYTFKWNYQCLPYRVVMRIKDQKSSQME